MSVSVAAPTVEHHREPLGIGESSPRLSWKTVAPAGWTQVAYQLWVEREATGSSPLEPVSTADSVLVPWPDTPLSSRERAAVRVRVRGADGTASGWSEPTTLEAGLLSPGDWSAIAVGAMWVEDPDADDRRPPLLRREFALDAEVASARLYVTAHGLYEIELNGQRVGREALAPGWTSYRHRLRYQTYDVTHALRRGANAIGAWMGDGWYRGRLGWLGGFRNIFGTDLSLLAQLEIRHRDGSVVTVATDGTWRAAPGPIVASGLYDGEHYDARLEIEGWSSPGLDDSSWQNVVAAQRDPRTLVAPQGPPVRCTEEVQPIEVLTTPSGERVLDLGQNLVGRMRIRVSGVAGERVVLSTAEVLQDGELCRRPLRDARSTDEYVLAGRDVEVWEPRFTFHGFRYVQVTGWPGDLDAAVSRGDLTARVIHTDLERTGWFECSDPQVQRLHENVVWSMRGNFVDIPTDCPQRDERIGWTGDLQVFAPTASYLYDVSGMLSSWLRDVAAEQLPDGTVPWYVPVIPAHNKWTPIRPGAAWGDVATLTPWVLYERTGDSGLLEAQYDSARRWLELVERLAGPSRLWDTGFQLGDWLDPSAPPQDPADGATDRHLVATACFARSAERLARTAEVLGRNHDRERFDQLAAEVREAFTAAYVGSGGRMSSDAQTAYALAVTYALVPAELAPVAGERLAELVREADHRISTGFVGTPLVCDALTLTGHVDVAYDLLMERQAPSWLYAVDQGATTIWERWDSLRPDGSVNPGTMTSFNHYALGAVADWLHRVVAGLEPTSPGYRTIRFAPRPGGGLNHARAEHETPYGRAAVAWRVADEMIVVEVTLPTGTDGVVDLPGGAVEPVTSGTHRFTAEYAPGEACERGWRRARRPGTPSSSPP